MVFEYWVPWVRKYEATLLKSTKAGQLHVQIHRPNQYSMCPWDVKFRYSAKIC